MNSVNVESFKMPYVYIEDNDGATSRSQGHQSQREIQFNRLSARDSVPLIVSDGPRVPEPTVHVHPNDRCSCVGVQRRSPGQHQSDGDKASDGHRLRLPFVSKSTNDLTYSIGIRERDPERGPAANPVPTSAIPVDDRCDT
jgi:hypothetical protein